MSVLDYPSVPQSSNVDKHQLNQTYPRVRWQLKATKGFSVSFSGGRENNLNQILGVALSIFYSTQLHGIRQLEIIFFLVQNKVHAAKSKKLGNGWNYGLKAEVLVTSFTNSKYILITWEMLASLICEKQHCYFEL